MTINTVSEWEQYENNIHGFYIEKQIECNWNTYGLIQTHEHTDWCIYHEVIAVDDSWPNKGETQYLFECEEEIRDITLNWKTCVIRWFGRRFFPQLVRDKWLLPVKVENGTVKTVACDSQDFIVISETGEWQARIDIEEWQLVMLNGDEVVTMECEWKKYMVHSKSDDRSEAKIWYENELISVVTEDNKVKTIQSDWKTYIVQPVPYWNELCFDPASTYSSESKQKHLFHWWKKYKVDSIGTDYISINIKGESVYLESVNEKPKTLRFEWDDYLVSYLDSKTNIAVILMNDIKVDVFYEGDEIQSLECNWRNYIINSFSWWENGVWIDGRNVEVLLEDDETIKTYKGFPVTSETANTITVWTRNNRWKAKLYPLDSKLCEEVSKAVWVASGPNWSGT